MTNVAQRFRQETVLGHRVKNAGLAIEQHEHDAREPRNGAHLYNEREPAKMNIVGRQGERRRNIQ